MTSLLRFAHPESLQFLLLLPLLLGVALYLVQKKNKKMSHFFGQRMVHFLTASLSQKKRMYKLVLQTFVLFGMIIALAQPQAGKGERKVETQGVEMMILLDVSNSMLAEDSKPSRIEVAKKELMRLVDLSHGDRIGLVAFAGSAVLLSPLTLDKNALKMFLESLSPHTVSSQGTNFANALNVAAGAFQRGGAETTRTNVVTRAIVVASDGEDNEPGALELVENIKKEHGIHLFSLGLGTESGGPIPLRGDGGSFRGYKKDRDGKVVVTRTKGTVLKSLAKKGGGEFFAAMAGGPGVTQLRSSLDRLKKATFDSHLSVEYRELFQIPLLFIFVLGFLELLLSEKVRKGRFWRGRFEVNS